MLLLLVLALAAAAASAAAARPGRGQQPAEVGVAQARRHTACWRLCRPCEHRQAWLWDTGPAIVLVWGGWGVRGA